VRRGPLLLAILLCGACALQLESQPLALPEPQVRGPVRHVDTEAFPPGTHAELIAGPNSGLDCCLIFYTRVEPDEGGTAGRLLARRIAVSAEVDNTSMEDNAAIAELGLLTSPIPSDGILDNPATFTIIADDDEQTITVNPDLTNTSVDGITG